MFCSDSCFVKNSLSTIERAKYLLTHLVNYLKPCYLSCYRCGGRVLLNFTRPQFCFILRLTMSNN